MVEKGKCKGGGEEWRDSGETEWRKWKNRKMSYRACQKLTLQILYY